MRQFSGGHIPGTAMQFLSNLVCKVQCMKEISPIVYKLREVEISNSTGYVNNRFVCHAFSWPPTVCLAYAYKYMSAIAVRKKQDKVAG